MKTFLVGLFIFIASSTGFASEVTNQKPQVQVTPDIVDKIFKNAIKQVDELSGTSHSEFTLVTEVGQFAPSTMTLANSYYEVPYESYWKSILMVNIMFQNGFFKEGAAVFKGVGGLSYSYQERLARVKSKKSLNGSERTTLLRAHSLPLYAGLDFEYQRWVDFSPYVSARVGMQWVYQMGNLDGLEQGFWVPFYQLGVGVTLFEPITESSRTWFGGLKVSVMNQRSFSSSQTIDGLSTNLGVILKL